MFRDFAVPSMTFGGTRSPLLAIAPDCARGTHGVGVYQLCRGAGGRVGHRDGARFVKQMHMVGVGGRDRHSGL